MQGSFRGSDESFATFYADHVSMVVRILGKIGVHDADIPDITQHVFIKIYKIRENPAANGVEVSLETICRQQAAEHYRLHRHRFEHPEPNVGAEIQSEEDDAHTQLERHELDLIVQRVLDSMEPASRDLLVRRLFQKESLESIATAHNITRNTVYARLAEAQKIFRLRAERILGEKHSRMLLLPFAMQMHNGNGELSTEFIAEVEERVWGNLTAELGLQLADRHAVVADDADKEPRQTQSRRRRDGWAISRSPRSLLGILTNPALLLSTGIFIGFVGASLWPLPQPAIARRMPQMLGGVIVVGRNADQNESAGAAPSSSHRVVEKNSPSRASPTPKLDNELRSLQRARLLVTEGKYAEAVRLLQQHEQDFPRSEHAATRNRYMALAAEGLRLSSAPSTSP